MTRCELCPGDHKCLPPDGPEDSSIILLGEAPGLNEERSSKIFIGKTGDELNRGYLPICNLRRENVRIMNCISCLPPGPQGKINLQRAKDADLLRSCAEHNLYPELLRKKWDLIVPLGAFACHAINPDIDLELQHGMPVQTEYGTAFPMYHPAGGIHEPKKMLHIRTDWTRLAKYLKGKLRLAVDQFAGNEQYEWLQSPEQVHDVLAGYWDQPLACDTESTRDRNPYCITFSAEPGTGFLIKADDLLTLEAFQKELDRWKGVILFHNWLYDCDVVRKMGLRFNHRRVRDTMVMAFHLGNIPQGLKALAYRELGMTMMDFDDLVTPYSRELVLEYYRQCFAEEWGKPDEEMVRDAKGAWKLYKPQGFNQKLKRFFTDFDKNPNKDPFDMWHNNWESLHAMVQERMGPFPGKCISHAAAVDWEAVKTYAMKDADATLRIYHVLCKMRAQVRKTVQESWRDRAA